MPRQQFTAEQHSAPVLRLALAALGLLLPSHLLAQSTSNDAELTVLVPHGNFSQVESFRIEGKMPDNSRFFAEIRSAAEQRIELSSSFSDPVHFALPHGWLLEQKIYIFERDGDYWAVLEVANDEQRCDGLTNESVEHELWIPLKGANPGEGIIQMKVGCAAPDLTVKVER